MNNDNTTPKEFDKRRCSIRDSVKEKETSNLTYDLGFIRGYESALKENSVAISIIKKALEICRCKSHIEQDSWYKLKDEMERFIHCDINQNIDMVVKRKNIGKSLDYAKALRTIEAQKKTIGVLNKKVAKIKLLVDKPLSSKEFK